MHFITVWILQEVKTCFRDPSSFAGQMPRSSNVIKLHLFNTIYPVINSVGRNPDAGLLLAVSKLF